MNLTAQTPEKLAADWEKGHITTMFPSDVRHADLKRELDQLKQLGIKIDEVGRSFAGREIYQVEWGSGPLKVFMWSQMHGDEPTATSALVDMFSYLQKNHGKDWVKKIGETMTIRAVPMLNPDGQEFFQRRNLQGIDINRDALDLKTPEARLLKKLREEWSPAIGFNLHNQNALTVAGGGRTLAAITFLVVYGDAAKTTNEGQERNIRIAAAMVEAMQKFIPGHISRYSDEYTPTAFGDSFSAWGTPTILIETGALHGQDEMYLVKLNFVAFMTALQSLSTGSEKTQDTAAYLTLPGNVSGSLVNFIFRSANLVRNTTAETYLADIAATTNRHRASMVGQTLISAVGNLNTLIGLEEYDASGFNVAQRFGQLKPGEMAEFFFYKKDRTVDWAAADLEKKFPPDAIFSLGNWVKGEHVVPRTISAK